MQTYAVQHQDNLRDDLTSTASPDQAIQTTSPHESNTSIVLQYCGLIALQYLSLIV